MKGWNLAMIGYKMLYRDLKSIWFHYQYEKGTIHEEIGHPVVQRHGFHFYEKIEDVPDMDKFFTTMGYVLVKVEALGEIVSKSQAQPPDYEPKMLYCTNKIRVLKVESRNAVTQLIDFTFDTMYPLRFVVSDYLQMSRAWFEDEYSRLPQYYLHDGDENAWDEQDKEKKADYPSIFSLDANVILEGPDTTARGDMYVLSVGHPDALTASQKGESFIINGTLITGGYDPGHEDDLTEDEWLSIAMSVYQYIEDTYVPIITVDGPLYITTSTGIQIGAIVRDEGVYEYVLDDPNIYYVSNNTEWTEGYNGVIITASAEGDIVMRFNALTINNSATDIPFINITNNVNKATIRSLATLNITSGNALPAIVSGAKTTIIDGNGSLVITSLGKADAGIHAVHDLSLTNLGGINISKVTTGILGRNITIAEGVVITMASMLDYAMYASKDLTISTGTSIKINKTGSDALHANDTITINGGITNIAMCYGDGIRGENVIVNDGNIVVYTSYDESGVDYFDSKRGEGKYNIMNVTDTSIAIKVYVPMDGHNGIHAGTEGAEHAVPGGMAKVVKPSGSLEINGGTITVNTTETGLTYDKDNTKYTIIGMPGDAILAENTMRVSGGKLTLSASTNAITVRKMFQLTGKPEITVLQAYRGIEAGVFATGAYGSTYGPMIDITTFSDSIRCVNKVIRYVLPRPTDEDQDVYTKTVTFNSEGTTCTLYSGTIELLSFDGTKRIYLNTARGSISIDVSGHGNGIRCVGNLYVYGATTKIFTSDAMDVDPISFTGQFITGQDAILLASGRQSHLMKPTTSRVPFVQFSEIVIDKSYTIAVSPTDTLDELISAVLRRSSRYVIFISKDLRSGSSYTLLRNGTVIAVSAARL